MRDFGSILARYKDVAGWLLRDAFIRFRRDFLTALALNGASLVIQFAALGVIYRYLHAIEVETPIVIAGDTYEPQSSITLLLMTGGTLLLLFGGATFLGYLGRIRALKLGRAYEEFCSRRAIVLVNSRNGPNLGAAQRRLQGLLAIHRYA